MYDGSHILVVDDEPAIRDVLRLLLEKNGYTVSEAGDGASAVGFVASHPDLDLVILDVMMPGISGTEACDAMRAYSNAPILFLTAKTGEDDRLAAYRSGGDDFLSKPFSQAVLLAKVESLLRRYKQYRGKPDAGLTVSSLAVDLTRRNVKREGARLDLTDKEYSILEYLLRRRGSVVSAQELYEQVWQEKYLPSSTNTVMVHILNLRKKVEDDASSPKIIRTVWGKGYQID
ncbi:MAG: response regulator transcription factor [Butyricicoccus sp.]|nr:response regulator transcription factor [Butyricicoccus sp.]